MLIIIPLLFVAIVFAVTFAEYRKVFYVRGIEATGFREYFFSLYPGLEKESFSCASGKESLYGLKIWYKGKIKGLIVLIHGYGLNMEHYLTQAEYLAKAGFIIVLFDGVGIGRSSGANIRGLPQHVTDACTVLDYVQSSRELSSLPLLLYGHSWGGWAANAASCLKSYPIEAILSVAGYYDSLGAMRASIRARYGVLLGGVVMLPLAFYQRLAFGRTSGYTAVRGLKAAGCPALLVHSKNDPVLPFKDNFEKIKKALQGRENTGFWEVCGGNHNLGVPAGADERCRQLRKLIQKNADDGLTQELWSLQMMVDEEMMKVFLDFYNDCIDTRTVDILT